MRRVRASVVALILLAAAAFSAKAFGSSAHVDAINFSFEPFEVHVQPGDTVDWANPKDGVTHTVTDNDCPRAFGPGPCEFDSEFTMEPGKTFVHTFNAAGRFDYRCTIHGFNGVVVVGDALTAPSEPRFLFASRGPAGGQISLQWFDPIDDGGTAVTAYRIYRGGTSQGETLLTEVDPATLQFQTITSHFSAPNHEQRQFFFTDGSNPAGTRFFYKISAVNSSGESRRSFEASATTPGPPAAPFSLAASRVGTNQVSLSWQGPFDDGGIPITSFRVYRGEDIGSETFLAQVAANSFSFADSGLPASKRFIYRVSAVNQAGEGLRSLAASSTTSGLATSPRSVFATRGPGRGQITLNWQVPSQDAGQVTGYRIYRGGTQGSETLAGQVSTLGFTDSGLADNALVFYLVAAVSPAGEGAFTNEFTARAPTVPGQVFPFDASAGPGRGQIKVSWFVPFDNGGISLTNFRIYRSDSDGGPFTKVGEVGTVTNFTDSGLPDAAIRFYRVSAVNPVGEGPQSFTLPGHAPGLPGAPGNLRAALVFTSPVQVGVGQIQLRWNQPTDDGFCDFCSFHITAYKVYRGTSSDDLTFLAQVNGSSNTRFSDGSCKLQTQCFYRVSAVNVVGESARSNAVSADGWAPPI